MHLALSLVQVCITHSLTMLAFFLIALAAVHAAQIPFFEASHDRKPGAPEEIYIKQCASPFCFLHSLFDAKLQADLQSPPSAATRA